MGTFHHICKIPSQQDLVSVWITEDGPLLCWHIRSHCRWRRRFPGITEVGSGDGLQSVSRVTWIIPLVLKRVHWLFTSIVVVRESGCFRDDCTFIFIMFPSLQNLFLNLLGNAFWSIYKPQKKICFTIYRLFYNLLSYFVQYLVFWRNQHTLPYHFSFLFVKLGSEFLQNSDVGFKKQSILCATRTWVFLKHNLVILMLKVTQKFSFLFFLI